MKASVIIPVYNASVWAAELTKSIELNIDSVGEVIFVNDGDDHDFELFLGGLNASVLERAKIFHTSGKRGPGFSRNIGLSHAEFPIIAFLDCDDVWLAGSLARRIEFLAKNSACSFVSTAFYKILVNGEKKTLVTPPRESRAGDILITNHVFLSSVVLRKSDLDDIRFEIIGHEDLLFWVDLIRKCGTPALCLEEPICLMRTTPKSVSSVKSRSAKWYWRIISRFDIPIPIRVGMFVVYTLNAFSKRIKRNYTPFYFGLNKSVYKYT